MPAATGEPQGAGPEMVAQYRLDAVIARGGLATVCRATDTTLGRTVALKIIDDGARAPALIAEARNTSRLSHPPHLRFGENRPMWQRALTGSIPNSLR